MNLLKVVFSRNLNKNEEKRMVENAWCPGFRQVPQTR